MPTVLVLPDNDLATRSASGFILRYIVPRVEPVHLYSILARRGLFVLSAPQSDLIIGVGHGDETTFSGQNEAVILEVGKYDPREVKGKVIKLLSCETGVALGPDLVRNGALAVQGYTDDYVWVMDADFALTPWSDEIAAKALMPVVWGLNALLDGKTAREALEVELDGYAKNAEVEEDELIKALLEFNHDNAILIGEGGARIAARPPLPLLFKLVPPPPIILPIS